MFRTRYFLSLFFIALMVAALAIMSTATKKTDRREKSWTESYRINSGELISIGEHPCFILKPNYQLVLEGKEGKKLVHLEITVLPETKMVDGVETRVVEERESADGKLVEISRNYYAISKRTNSVYYFGEDVDIYENGKIVGHEGAWRSGEDEAKFGLMMPGIVLFGSRYYQEIAPDVAMDRAEIVDLDASVDTPAGKFQHCLKIEETTPLEPGVREYKWYTPGIGLVQDGKLRLVRYGVLGE